MITVTPNSDFIGEYCVGDKTLRLDALLVLSALTIHGNVDNPSPEVLIKAVRRAVRPIEEAETLTDEEAYALSLRITMSLKSLGNAGAP